jgi:hypothetical protein
MKQAAVGMESCQAVKIGTLAADVAFDTQQGHLHDVDACDLLGDRVLDLHTSHAQSIC